MKTRNSISVLILLLVAATVVTSTASAQRHFRRHQPGMMRLEMLADKLDLTESQIAELKGQRFASEKKSIEMRSKIQVARLELRNLMQDENVDENKIKTKVKEIGKLKTDLQLNRVEARLGMRKVLTSEQLDELKTIKKEWMKDRHERGRSFRNRGPFGQSRSNFGPGAFDSEQNDPYDE